MSFKAEDTAAVLTQALPYIQRFSGSTVVVKYGGSTMGGDHLA
ncbi:MAG: acetylglutamate kinase, partial [bacterium]|nr:acetylglutamate kinase [bacterium]